MLCVGYNVANAWWTYFLLCCCDLQNVHLKRSILIFKGTYFQSIMRVLIIMLFNPQSNCRTSSSNGIIAGVPGEKP